MARASSPSKLQCEIHLCSQFFTLSCTRALDHATLQLLSLEGEYLSHTTDLGLGHVTYSGCQHYSLGHKQRLKICLYSSTWALIFDSMRNALGSPGLLPEARDTGRANLSPKHRKEPSLASISRSLSNHRLHPTLMLHLSH